MGCIGEGVSLPQGYIKNRKTTKNYNIQKLKPSTSMPQIGLGRSFYSRLIYSALC